jgi:hypothetical protein
MTIVGAGSPSGLGLTPVSRLKKYRFGLTRDYTASDVRQIPVGDASVTVYKQGAHASSAASILPGGSGTINVWDIGKIVVGDTIFHETDDSITAQVSAVTTETISVTGVAGGMLSWSMGGRFRALTNLPTLYGDIHSGGAALDNPLALDARGLAECYAVDNIVDAIIEGDAISTVSISDEVGAFPLAEVRYADEFPGDTWGEKLAAALADLDETYGGIVDCRGLRGLQAAAEANPFVGVTWPYTVILGHGIYNTDVAIQAALGNYQSVLGAGMGQTTLRASLAFPSATPLMRWGNASGALGCRIADLTLDCSGVASSVGLHAAGCKEGALAENLEVLNAKLYGVRLNNTLVACRDFRMRNLRVHTSDTAAIGVIFDTGCGANNSLDGLYAASETGITGTAAVQKNVAVPVSIKNVSALRYTHNVHLNVPAGGANVQDIYGETSVTNVVKVESGVAEYALRNIVRNSSTNVLNDANMPAASTVDVLSDAVSGRMIILAQNTITPIVDLIVPSGATAADYILREIINGTARFGIRKDGVVQLSKISNELGHTPTTGSVHANFGSGATVVLQAGSSDMAGSIIITAGTTAGTNPTFVLTFGAAYHGLPRAAFVMPYIDSGSPYYGAGEFWFVASVTAGAITIGFQGTPTDSIAYRIAYFVVGGVA